MSGLGEELSRLHDQVARQKSLLVSDQELLATQSRLLTDIKDQLKHCETRLSMIKKSDLEARRAKRDNSDIQVLPIA